MQHDLAEDDLVARLAGAGTESDSALGPTLAVISAEIESLSLSLREPRDADPFGTEPELAIALEQAARLALEPVVDPTQAEREPASRTSEHPPEASGRQPEMLGQYELLDKLGSGGMGTVYRAVHRKLNRTVALKVLPGDRFQTSEAVARFEREMVAVGMLEHPHIVTAHDAGEVDGRHFLVMEYVEGIDVGQLVARSGPLPIAEACEIVRQTALGLQHIHEFGLVHRDIKPANLMLAQARSRKGPPTVKILDLGLALIEMSTLDNPRELTSTGQVMGTIDYMAPEQGLDTHSVDIRADLYSLGATLYKLLTGRAPLESPQHQSVMKRLLALERELPPSLIPLRPDCPPALNDLVLRLLSKSPDDRPHVPQIVADELAPFAQGADLHSLQKGTPLAPSRSIDSRAEAATVTNTRHAPTQITIPLATTSADPENPGRPRRWRRLLLIAALPLLVVLGAVISIATDQGRVTIEAPDDLIGSVSATILRNGVPTGENWNIKAGMNEHRIRTGTIEVRLSANPDDELELEPLGDLVVRRQGVVAYRLNKRSTTPDVVKSQPLATDSPPPAMAVAPFTPEQAKAHQAAWAKHLGVPVEYTNSIGMKFALIPPSEFLMGSTPAEVERSLNAASLLETAEDIEGSRRLIQSGATQRQVKLTQPIYLGVYEVTQAQYERLMGRNPSHFSPGGAGKDAVAGLETATHPVEKVSWNDAAEFCAKLSQTEQLKPFYFRSHDTVTALAGTGYRLPTEAEWEFSCRGGVSENTEDTLRSLGWFGVNSGLRTHAVGELQANPFGLYDMHGNAYEWVQDDWESGGYRYKQNDPPLLNPIVSSTAEGMGVIRGGHLWGPTPFGTASHRHICRRSDSSPSMGFRVALSVEAVQSRLKATGSVDVDRFALKFNGDAIVQIPSISYDGGSVTLEARVWMSQLTLQAGEIVRLTVPARSMGLWGYPPLAGVSVTDASRQLLTKTPWESLDASGPIDLAGVWDGSQVRLFVNGRLVATETEVTPSGPDFGKAFAVEEVSIGSRQGKPDRTFHGLIESVRISRSARYIADYVVPQRFEPDSDTLALYRFDEAKGEVLKDSSGHNHDGRIIGATWVKTRGNATDLLAKRSHENRIDRFSDIKLPPMAVAPFTSEQAKAHQAAWAKHLGVPVEYTNSIGMKFILIPPGEFLMGSTDEQIEAVIQWGQRAEVKPEPLEHVRRSERPQHRVVISKPFYLGLTEVTIGQFERLNRATGYQTAPERNADAKTFRQPGYEVSPDSPVTLISWRDAAAFCNWLSQVEKGTYRLPTEAEHEYAGRAGTITDYPFGDGGPQVRKHLWSNQNSGEKAQTVGTKPANAFGLFDMHGNVWEWCRDLYDESWYAHSSIQDPNGPASGDERVMRGGSWYGNPLFCRSAYRTGRPESFREIAIGFRCVRVLESGTTVSAKPPVAVPAPSPRISIDEPPPLEE
jgi:formylglycine-generating enzyme required for sulfatase activity/serine/threonine protein kinase